MAEVQVEVHILIILYYCDAMMMNFTRGASQPAECVRLH